MGNACKSMADSFQCMTKRTTIKKKKNYWAEDRLKVVLYNREYSQYCVLAINGK